VCTCARASACDVNVRERVSASMSMYVSLFIGDANVPRPWDNSPWVLDQNSMKEIMYAGFTLQAIAAGKVQNL